MRKSLLVFSAVFLNFISNSQNCKQSTSSIELDINNVRAIFLNCGDIFWDHTGTGNIVEVIHNFAQALLAEELEADAGGVEDGQGRLEKVVEPHAAAGDAAVLEQ